MHPSLSPQVAATVRVDAPELRAALQAEAGVLALLARLEPEQVRC